MSIDALTKSFLGLLDIPSVEAAKQKFITEYGLSPYTQLDTEADLTDADKALLWKAIASKFGYDPLVETTPPSSFDVLQAAYTLFLHGKLSQIYEQTLQTVSSPKEQEARKVTLQLFEIAINMMVNLESTLRKENALLTLLTKWKSEYTQELTRIPLYGPEMNAAIFVDKTNFGNTTLGFGKISVREVLDYLISDIETKKKATTPGQGVIIYESTWGIDKTLDVGFRLQYTEDGTYTLSLMSSAYASTTPTYPLITVSASYDLSRSLTSQQSGLTAQLLKLFTDKWNNHPGASDIRSAPDFTDPVTVPYVPPGEPTELLSGNGQSYYLGYFYNDIQTHTTNNPDGTTTTTTTNTRRAVTFGYLKKLWETASYAYSVGTLDDDASIPKRNITWKVTTPAPSMGDEVLPGAGTPYYFPGYYLWGPWAKAWPMATGTTGWSQDQIDTAKTDQAQYRASKNAMLQQYIETAKARRQAVTDQASITQGVIEQLKQALSGQIDVLHSFMDTLKALISAIFR